MAVPEGVVWDRDPHTEAKHRILRHYLDAYFPIMASAWRSTGLAFVDAFAGPGEYSDESIGSPIIAIRAARRPDVISTQTHIQFVFIEEDERRFQHLKALLNSEPLPASFDRMEKHGSCEEALIPELDRLSLWDGPMFVNFDGWGVDTRHTLVERVGRSKAPEVFVTFKDQWFTRFAEVQDVEAGDLVFGDKEWRAVSDCQTPADKRRFLIDEYLSHLTVWGFPYHLTFELVDEGGHELLLVFGTGNRLGITKMKDAMWRVDAVSGSRFRDPRDPNQLAFDLSDGNPNLLLLRQQLLEQVESDPKTMSQLKDFTLLETVFKEAHAKRAVDELEAQRLVECDRARTHDQYVVRRAPRSLFG